MTLNIEVIKPTIGAIIHDVDLNTADENTTQQIQQALLDHHVIFFRNQQLAPQAQAELARGFGSLHIHPIFPTVENVPVGGDTLWSSGAAAFAALDQDLQQKLKGLTATHDIRQSFPIERFAHNDVERQKLEETFKRNPPVIHPVVRTHPVTGEPILFISEGFTTRINELDETESAELLQYLFAHATNEQFYLRWQWQEGDVAIWDNRCTQHKALFDYGDAHRIIHRATINGDVPFYQAAS